MLVYSCDAALLIEILELEVSGQLSTGWVGDAFAPHGSVAPF